MQQNYINPETSPLPDIATVKRSLEFKNYLFNRNQLQRKTDIIKRQKHEDILRSALQNQKTQIQIQNQKLYQLHKKIQAQETLKNAYDQQIYSRLRYKTQEKSYDKDFSQRQKQMLENQERSRVHDIGRMYNIGSSQNKRTNYFPNRKILTQQQEDSLDHLKYQHSSENNNLNFVASPKTENFNTDALKPPSSNQAPKFSFSSIQQPSLENSRSKKYSAVNLEYSDYLKKEIERRQKTKEEQKKRELEKDKSWVEYQNKSHSEKMEELNYLNQKKKYDYATGLNQQLSWKRQFANKL